MEAIEEFDKIFNFSTNPQNRELWLIRAAPRYSFYDFGSTAIIAFFRHRRERATPIGPILKVEKGGWIYDDWLCGEQKFLFCEDKAEGDSISRRWESEKLPSEAGRT